MAVQFDFDSVPDSLESGADFAADGSYHLKVTALDEGVPSEGKSMKVTCEVLGGQPATEVGKLHVDYFNWPTAGQDPEKKKNTVKRILLLALACRVITEEEIEAAKQQGKGPSIDFTLCLERQFCAKISSKPYKKDGVMVTGKPSFGYDIWPIGSEQAKGIQLNEVELAKQGDAATDPFGGLKF